MASISVVDGKDIAEPIITTIGQQIDSLSTLSIAICGGIIAMIFQVIIHNRSEEPANRIHLVGIRPVAAAILAEGISSLFGYLAKGTLVSTSANLYAAQYNVPNPIDAVPIEGSGCSRPTCTDSFFSCSPASASSWHSPYSFPFCWPLAR